MTGGVCGILAERALRQELGGQLDVGVIPEIILIELDQAGSISGRTIRLAGSSIQSIILNELDPAGSISGRTIRLAGSSIQ